MTDHEFESFIQREAADYNAPPATPRDAMWEAIAAKRRAAAPAPRLVVEPTTASIAPMRRHTMARTGWLIGMAATLVLGVAIGRFAWRGASAESGSTTLASVPNGPTARTADGASIGYQVAATQHLERAEALLTSVRANGGRPGDAAVAAWTRDVLTNTRLLLDSPAGVDPTRRKLLEDLELVLVQLVQRTPGAAPEAGEDRAHVNRSLEHTQVLPRLRAALAAEPVRGS